jgi:hypothetical protein
VFIVLLFPLPLVRFVHIVLSFPIEEIELLRPIVHSTYPATPESWKNFTPHKSNNRQDGRYVCALKPTTTQRPSPNKNLLTFNCSEVDVLVIGAGPTGLGAAKRLNQIVRLPSASPPILQRILTTVRMVHHG